VPTGRITIPEEHFLYCVDQHQLDLFGKDPKEKKPGTPKVDPDLLKPGEVAFQIHQWTEIAPDGNTTLYIGDWAIAERVKVKRGDLIGTRALVQAPAWFALKDAFEVPLHKEDIQIPGKKKESVFKTGF